MATFRERVLGLFGLSYSPAGEENAKAKPRPGSLGKPTLYANPRMQTTQSFTANRNLLVQRKGFRVLNEMRKDDMVKAAMLLKKQCVVVSGYKIEPAEGETPDDEMTVFVEDALKKVQGGLIESILEMLTTLDYGFSVTEKIFDKNEEGKIVLKRLLTVAPDDISFETDPFGQLTAICQAGNKTSTDKIPLGKFIVWTWDGEFGNWYGRPDLEAAHRPWLIKSQAYNWLGILLERFGIPPVFIHFDEQGVPKPVQAALQDALENWQTGAWGLIPRGEKPDSIGFYSPELAGATGGVFIPAFEMFDKAISRSLLMPGLLGVTPDAQQGSFARAAVHFDVFMLVVEYCRNQAEQIINEHIVRPMVDFNFPGVEQYPMFKWNPLSDEVRESLLTVWGTLTGQKVVQTSPADEDHIRKALKFPDRATAQQSIIDDPNADGSTHGPQPTDPDPNNPGFDSEGNPLPPPEDGPEEDPANPGFDTQGNPMPEPDPKADPNAQDPEADPQDPKKKKKPIPPKLKPKAKAPPPKFVRGRQGAVKKFSDGSEPSRALTKHEAKVDFNAIIKDLDGITAGYLERLRAAVHEIQDAVLLEVRSSYKPQMSYLTKWGALPKTDALYEGVEAFMKEGFARGRESMRREMPGAKFAAPSLPMADVDDALNYLKTKALWVSEVTDAKVLQEVRAALLQGVANGEPLDEIMVRLRDVFRPYVEQAVDDKGVLLEPARLETIIRTNLTDVYNQGRLVQGEQAEEFLEGWQYSAIIDGRTTEVCQALDGTTFEAGDARVNSLRPPRHFNCRSVLVPIVVGETIDPDTLITEAKYNDAKTLSGKGFKLEN